MCLSNVTGSELINIVAEKVSFGILIVVILKITFVVMKMVMFLMMGTLSQCLKVSL